MSTPTLPFAEARETFLALFPAPKRGTIANWFLYPVRSQGATTPRAVLASVVAMLRDRIAREQRYGYDLNGADEQLAIILSHESEALDFAAYYLAYAQLPEAERESIKDAQRQQHKDAWMTEHPPSERQLAYLQSLGYAGTPPATMREASVAIDRLASARGKAVLR